jgi:hypothetical protein
MGRLTRAGLVFATAWLAGSAQAHYYSLVAQAGGSGDAASDVGDTSVAAAYANPSEPSSNYESYDASANGQGSLSASANALGIPPFAPISHRAAARIEETIRFLPPPFPNGPVTVRAGISAAPVASSANGGSARAGASVQIEPFSESCIASISHTGETGGSCLGGTVTGTSVTRTFTLDELSNRQWEVDVAAQVEASIEIFAANGSSASSASGALWVEVSGGGVTEYYWSGTGTNIPVPEPGALTVAASAFAGLATLRRGRG